MDFNYCGEKGLQDNRLLISQMHVVHTRKRGSQGCIVFILCHQHSYREPDPERIKNIKILSRLLITKAYETRLILEALLLNQNLTNKFRISMYIKGYV